MSKNMNTKYAESKNIGTKITDYFEKYSAEILCAMSGVNGSAIDYSTICGMCRK